MNLQTKTLYADTLDELCTIKKDCDMAFDGTQRLKDAVDTMPILVPVVGEFSAGKSTMLNKLIGRDMLAVSMKPETAIPVELYYSLQEYDEGVYADGRAERISDVSQAAGKYVCVRRHINSAFLREIQPLTLVDMPGFDSPLNEHNAAIFNYLDSGIHYAVLIPADAGTISKSMERQIYDIINFGKKCTFFLSKTDSRGVDDIASIKSGLEAQLYPFTGGCTLQEVNKDDVSLFSTFVNTLQPDSLFKQQFQDRILDECYDTKNALNTRIAALKTDKDKNARAISELQAGIEKIEAKKIKMTERAKNDSYSDEADSIASAVGSALNANLDSLVSIAQTGGQEALQEEISSIVKTTVISQVQSMMGNIASRFGKDLAGEINCMDELFSQYNAPDTIARLQQSAETLFDSFKTSVEGYMEDRKKQENEGEPGKNINGIGSVFSILGTGASIAGQIVAPIVSIISMLLPQIFTVIFGGIQKETQKSQLRQKISGQIPAIKRQVRMKIVELLKQNSAGVIDALCEKFDTELKSKQHEIETVQQANEVNAAKLAAEAEKLGGYVSKIEAMLEKIVA
ncbi:MAG: dynamin family protein [Treponema sp.]